MANNKCNSDKKSNNPQNEQQKPAAAGSAGWIPLIGVLGMIIVAVFFGGGLDSAVNNEPVLHPAVAALRSGKVEEMKQFLCQNDATNPDCFDVNFVFDPLDGNTLLHVAVSESQMDAARWLIEKGAEPNAVNKKERTPFHIACWEGDEKLVNLLISHGANFSALDTLGRTPLHYAMNASSTDGTKVVYNLLEKGSDVNAPDIFGRTPLELACEFGKADVVKMLLSHNAEVNVFLKDSNATPLGAAAFLGYTDIVEALLEAGADPDAGYNGAASPLALACDAGHVDIFNLLIPVTTGKNHEIDQYFRCLWAAVKKDHVEIVKRIIATEKVDINQNNVRAGNSTVVHVAGALMKREILDVLFQNKPDFDKRDNVGRTPLASCAFSGVAGCVELLADQGSEVNTGDINGDSPLHYLRNRDIAKTLLKHGANVSAPSNNGTTPIIAAAHRGDLAMMKLLVEHGADINEQNSMGDSSLLMACWMGHNHVVKYLLRNGVQMSIHGQKGSTPLHAAAYHGRSEIVKMLLEAGAELNLKNDGGATPLHAAIWTLRETIAVTLIAFGSSLEDRANDGNTAIHYAAAYGAAKFLNASFILNESLAQELMESFNGDGYNALHLAAKHGKADCVVVLLHHGADAKKRSLKRAPALANMTPLSMALMSGPAWKPTRQVLENHLDEEARKAAREDAKHAQEEIAQEQAAAHRETDKVKRKKASRKGSVASS